MTFRALAKALGAYFVALVLLCAVLRRAVALRDVHGETITSAWKHGELAGRTLDAPLTPSALFASTVVREEVIAEAPLVTWPESVFALSVVASRDGVKATLDGKTAYVTPDDLLARQGYDHGIDIPSLSLAIGVDVPLIEALLAERLDVTVADLRARARFRRFRVKRTVTSPTPPAPFANERPDQITPDALRASALDAARFLARGVLPDGHFRYIVDAPTNRTLGGYDWPRHAGATYFVAQAAELSHDPALASAALRAASLLRDRTLATCGANKCIGNDDTVDLGSSALGLIAFAQIASAHLDDSYRASVDDLARFIRSQQRPDGEFMHWFDRRTKAPVDVQLLYYSGEASLALARAYALTGHAEDLDAAKRGLAHLVGPAWSFFGDRYYFGEEHWTCQVMAELWDHAPDPKALDFCERWQVFGRNMMHDDTDTPFDADGSYGVGPLVTPRLTPAASRAEAGVATLEAMIKANAPAAERDALASQLKRSLALLLREQLRPGAVHLFAAPSAVYGAIPGSPVDWQLRIDYSQHAGSAMLRAADLWSVPAR